MRTVVIDSLNGYQLRCRRRRLILHMHELLQYLNRQGATTFLTVAQHGLVGDMKAPVDVTYLADTVCCCAISKRRAGPARDFDHQETDRRARKYDPRIQHRPNGITLGARSEKFQGVLRGVPQYVGRTCQSRKRKSSSGSPCSIRFPNVRLFLHRKGAMHRSRPISCSEGGLDCRDLQGSPSFTEEIARRRWCRRC